VGGGEWGRNGNSMTLGVEELWFEATRSPGYWDTGGKGNKKAGTKRIKLLHLREETLSVKGPKGDGRPCGALVPKMKLRR